MRELGGLIHVAGVVDLVEARMLVECGVGHLGLPLALDFHEPDLTVAEAAAMVSTMRRGADFFVITYLDSSRAVADLCSAVGVSRVQLHGPIELSEIRELRCAWPELHVIKSLIAHDDNFSALRGEAERFTPWVDAFIVDTFDPATGARGATGKVHDWAISRRLVESCSRPLILAGGLDPDNVRRAIAAVGPAGVDVHTGVEGPDGRKQRARVERFVAQARAAFRSPIT